MGKPKLNPKSTDHQMKSSILSFFSASKKTDLSGKKRIFDEKTKKKCVEIPNQPNTDTCKPCENSVRLDDRIKTVAQDLTIEKQKTEKLSKDLKHAKMLVTEASKINHQKELKIQKLSQQQIDQSVIDGFHPPNPM